MLFACGALQAVPRAEYDAAIQMARNGSAAAAVVKLEAWHRADPQERRILHDLATVLGMAGRHEAALQYYTQIVRPDAPAYAIKSMAASARAAGKPIEAENAYTLLIRKSPNDGEAHAGLLYAWMAQGRIESASAYLKERLPPIPSAYTRNDVPLLVVQAELHEHRQDWLQAAAAHQHVLHFEPGFRYALRGRVFALARAGAFELAKRLADGQPETFSEEEKARLAQDAVARAIVYGQVRLATDDGPMRFAATDLALLRNAELLERFPTAIAAKVDRLVALRDRQRMREAVALYESLIEEGVTAPSYARVAAADAYLYLEQPDTARALYRSVLDEHAGGGPAEADDWQIALIYACSESERHDEAEALADRLLRTTPSIRYKGTPAVEAPNPGYSRMALMAALVRLYADRLDAAQQRLAELRALAPSNSGIRSAWASLQSARERPRAALEEFTRLQLDEPGSIDASIGLAETLLALNRFDEAREATASLLARRPENKAVQNLARRIGKHDSLQLKVETTLGSGASIAGAESVLRATLHSAPLIGSLGGAFRIFSQLSRTDGENAGSFVSRTRIGAGIDYRAQDMQAEMEVNRAAGSAAKNGVVLALSWSLSDAWHAHVALDTNVNELSAAAYRSGVTAHSAAARITWIDHESRRVQAELSRMHFSDENIRDTARAWWSERWISGPAFKLETAFSLSASTNSLAGTNYFNPRRDREASITLAGEWLNWRHYHRSFRQRLAYTFGHYRQQDFGGGATGDLRYEHEWRDDNSASVRYGLGHSFHPYDGDREGRNYGFMNLHWLIK